MLTGKQKRFYAYWQKQKAGGKLSFLFTNTIANALMVFFTPLLLLIITDFLLAPVLQTVLSVNIDLYQSLYLEKLSLWMAFLLAIITGLLISLFQWKRNEKKWVRIQQEGNGS